MSIEEFNDALGDPIDEASKPIEPLMPVVEFNDALRDPIGESRRPIPAHESRAHRRESARAILAFGLLGLLAVLAVAALGAVIAGASVEDVRAIAEVVFPPVVALAGSATGFYFGSETES